MSGEKTLLQLCGVGVLNTIPYMVLQPLEVVKTQMISRNETMNQVLKNLGQSEFGYKGVFRGTTFVALSMIPASVIYFYGISLFRKRYGRSSGFEKNFMGSAAARAVVTILGNPLMVIRTHLENFRGTRFPMRRTVTGIYGTSGFAGFFRGLGSLMIRQCLMSGFFFSFYEHFRTVFSKKFGLEMNSVSLNALSTTTASIVACFVVHPFEVMRVKSQLGMKFRLSEYSDFRKLFQGLGPKTARKTLQFGLSWLLYENVFGNRDEST